jgi:hypothetical protein
MCQKVSHDRKIINQRCFSDKFNSSAMAKRELGMNHRQGC